MSAVVATKFGMKMEGMGQGAEAGYCGRPRRRSLRRLGMERIDLYQLHKPDANTPIADTLGALNDLVQEGKVREIGCSNFSVEQLREAEKAAGNGGAISKRTKPVQSVSPRPRAGVLAECDRQGWRSFRFFRWPTGC